MTEDTGRVHVKRRQPAPPGSIPDQLQMFTREVRFYRELAGTIGVRVPACRRAGVLPDGSTLLELEDLSDWRPGADPVAAARTLRLLHDRWAGTASESLPWLPRPDVSQLVEDLFAEEWAATRDRSDLPTQVRDLGDRLTGRVVEAERAAAGAGPWTLVHGDASSDNLRTSGDGEVALLDWEDYGAGPGVNDLAWFLVSSVDPDGWDRAVDAYGSGTGLEESLPAAAVQALLRLADADEGSERALVWLARVKEAARRIGSPG